MDVDHVDHSNQPAAKRAKKLRQCFGTTLHNALPEHMQLLLDKIAKEERVGVGNRKSFKSAFVKKLLTEEPIFPMARDQAVNDFYGLITDLAVFALNTSEFVFNAKALMKKLPEPDKTVADEFEDEHSAKVEEFKADLEKLLKDHDVFLPAHTSHKLR